MPEFDRYFLATPGGDTEFILADMERVADDILRDLRALKEILPPKAVPHRVIYNNKTIDLTLITREPSIKAADFLQCEFSRFTAPHAIESFIGFNFISHEGLSYIGRDVLEFMENIAEASNWLGLSPNIFDQFHGTSASEPFFYPDKDKAVLTINNQIFYPQARRVFADWVIKLPPFIEQCGNSFVPPDCELLTSEKLNKMTIGIPFEDFRHEHDHARAKLLSWPALTI